MKKAKLFLVAAAMTVCVGGAFALKAHRGITGDYYICVSGVCATSQYSSTNILGGTQEAPPVQFYATNSTVGAVCGQTHCQAVTPSTVWFHPSN